MSRSVHDVDTRQRLLVAGGRLFAAHGYDHVTIRDICGAARANIAAVNYHFAGKAALYDEVVQLAIATMQDMMLEVERAGHRRNPEDRLRGYVHASVTRVVEADTRWLHHVMLREMSEPTPALERIINDVVRPRMRYLGDIVAELLSCPPDDARVARCAFSVHAQCLAMMHSPLIEQLEPVATTNARVQAMVEHITEFSLAGLWALARST